jgi:hypothetical protein
MSVLGVDEPVSVGIFHHGTSCGLDLGKVHAEMRQQQREVLMPKVKTSGNHPWPRRGDNEMLVHFFHILWI